MGSPASTGKSSDGRSSSVQAASSSRTRAAVSTSRAALLVGAKGSPTQLVLATVFLLLGPPSFVLWSVSANAEIVMTLLAGTLMCLGLDVWRRTESRRALMVACVAAGFGLWVHQYIVYYVVAAGLAIAHGLPRRRVILGGLFNVKDMPLWMRWMTSWWRMGRRVQ